MGRLAEGKPTCSKSNLVETNVLTRWPCHVCGGRTEKEPILCEADDGFRVCENCLRDGDLDARLTSHADALINRANELRARVGRIKAPTYAEWLAAVEESSQRGMIFFSWTEKSRAEGAPDDLSF